MAVRRASPHSRHEEQVAQRAPSRHVLAWSRSRVRAPLQPCGKEARHASEVISLVALCAAHEPRRRRLQPNRITTGTLLVLP